MPAGKEATTAADFDESDYVSNLVDKEGYSEVTARMLAKKKRENLEAKKIEIDLGSLAKAKKRIWVKPTSKRKGHYREQKVGEKDSREGEMKVLEAEVAANRAQMAEPNEYGIAMRDINEGDYVDMGPHYGGGYVAFIYDAERFFLTENKEDRYKGESAQGWYVNLYDVREVSDDQEYIEEDDRSLYAPRIIDEKMEIDLGSLTKADEFEHLSPEERKKRQKERDKRQKDREKHRKDRKDQHDEVEAGIPEGK